MKIIFFIAIFLFGGKLWGQTTFQKVYKHTNNAGCFAAEKTTDNGYIIGGNVGIGSNSSLLIIKTDSIGDRKWSKTYDTPLGEIAYCVKQTNDGGYIFTGSSSTRLFIIKTNDTGKISWSKQYGSVNGFSNGKFIQQTTDNGYIVIGDAVGVNTLISNAIYLLKVDSLGNIQWTRTYNTLGDYGSYILEIKNGGFLITGSSSYTSPGRAFLMEINNTGFPLWTRSYGQKMGFSMITPAVEGEYILCGRTDSTQPYAPFILKIDSLFSPVWAKKYGTNIIGEFNTLSTTSDGGYILGTQDTSINIIKTDSSGTMIWARNIERPGYESTSLIDQVNDTAFILIGTTSDTINAPSDIYFVKTDSIGNTCFSSIINPIIQSFSVSVDTFNFNLDSINTSDTIIFTVGYGVTDSLLCSNNGINNVSQTIAEEHNLIIYPNPSNGAIEFKSEGKILNIEIQNTLGQIVFEGKFNSKIVNIDLRGKSKGIYTYKVYLERVFL